GGSSAPTASAGCRRRRTCCASARRGRRGAASRRGTCGAASRTAMGRAGDDALGTLGSLGTGGPAYAEQAPGPALAPCVQCFWSIRGSTDAPLPNRVLPDGCADVIVNLAATPYAFAVGPMRTASLVALVGRVDLFG